MENLIESPVETNETSVNEKNDFYVIEPGEVILAQNPLEIHEDLDMSVTEINEEFEMLYDEVFEVTLPSTLWAIQRFVVFSHIFYKNKVNQFYSCRDPEKKFIVFSCFDEKCMGNLKTIFLDNKNISKLFIRQKCVLEDKIEVFTTEHINNLLEEMDSYKVCAGIYSKDYQSCDGLSTDDDAYCNICKEISFE